MCPACVTSLAVWAAGGASAGGLGMLALARLRHPRGRDSRKADPHREPAGLGRSVDEHDKEQLK